MKSHVQRHEKAWALKAPWDEIYKGVFKYTLPFRKPGSDGAKKIDLESLYDNTAIVSTFTAAGRLQQDLFPPGEKCFTFRLGPLSRRLANVEKDRVEAERDLDEQAETIQAFFTPEFDQASLEMCLDLQAGFGVLVPVPGDDATPVRWVCIPMDECALEAGPFGDVWGCFWKTQMSYAQIKASFKAGKFPAEFMKKFNENPYEMVEIRQDWVFNSDTNKWEFWAWTACCNEGESAQKEPISKTESRTKPFASPRYHRVPGEAYGRGPALLALPTTKTLNRAVEIMLKAAAIQMLGLWAYRPNGTFNPATAKIQPGAMWAMGSTGGVLGPDVMRLDTPSGKMDVAQLVTQEMRLQLQAALNDDRIPDKGATPVSATEIMARMKRISRNYLGAYGRLVNETLPVLVRRVAEILHDRKLLTTKFAIDDLLVKVEVTSPMAQAIKATGLQQIFQFLEIVSALRGPQAMELIVKIDDLLADAAQKMGVPAQFRMSKDEREELKAKIAKAAADLAAAQANAAKPQGPEPVAA